MPRPSSSSAASEIANRPLPTSAAPPHDERRTLHGWPAPSPAARPVGCDTAAPAIRQARAILPPALGGAVAAQIVELDERGALLALDQPLPYGTELNIELYGTDADATIRNERAIVVHCLGRLVGCMFTRSSEARRASRREPADVGWGALQLV